MFSSAKSLNKIESLQKRALRYLYSDDESPYDKLLAKSGKVTMKASRLRSLCVEIYKSINAINPSFMNEIFRLRVTNRMFRSQYRLDLDFPRVNQVSFGNNSIRSFGPKIWNSLPPHIKSCENLETFKRVIKTGMSLLVTVEYAKTSHLNVPRTHISYFNLYIIYNLYFFIIVVYT